MRALRKLEYGKGNIDVVDVDKPTIVDDCDVLIRVKAAGVCGTDLHIYDDTFTYYPPVTLGHEFSGVVEAIGNAVSKFKIGDRVVAEPQSKACMVCDTCRRGYMQLCPDKRAPGWGIDGAFASHLVMPEMLLHKIPSGVSFEVAALAEPIAVVTTYLSERVKLYLSDVVVIVGAGPFGILSAMAAKAHGASKVIMLGLGSDEPLRFKIAKEFGVDTLVNVQKQDAQVIVADMTDGRMADVVIEASGSENGIKSAFHLARTGGRICAVGLTPCDEAVIPWNTAQRKMLEVYFNFSSSYTSWDSALKLMQNTRYDLDKLITHRESIDNWQSVFEDLVSCKGVKALFIPEE